MVQEDAARAIGQALSPWLRWMAAFLWSLVLDIAVLQAAGDATAAASAIAGSPLLRLLASAPACKLIERATRIMAVFQVPLAYVHARTCIAVAGIQRMLQTNACGQAVFHKWFSPTASSYRLSQYTCAVWVHNAAVPCLFCACQRHR
jgi:hypothetical protein